MYRVNPRNPIKDPRNPENASSSRPLCCPQPQNVNPFHNTAFSLCTTRIASSRTLLVISAAGGAVRTRPTAVPLQEVNQLANRLVSKRPDHPPQTCINSQYERVQVTRVKIPRKGKTYRKTISLTTRSPSSRHRPFPWPPYTAPRSPRSPCPPRRRGTTGARGRGRRTGKAKSGSLARGRGRMTCPNHDKLAYVYDLIGRSR